MSLKDQQPKKRWKKLLISLLLTVVIVVTLVIIFISPIAKYLVQKYDTKYLGRQVTMDWAYVNPFTGYVHLDNLKIYEINSDSVFIKVSGVSANFSMSKLLSKTYEINSLYLDNPKGMIIRQNDVFNFIDIIQRFSPKDTIVIAKKNSSIWRIFLLQYFNISSSCNNFFLSSSSYFINF